MNISKKPPVAVALHDLSSFGRCALTVICPALSAMGVQVCPVPTALLSTHTGGFEGFCFEDTTPFMEGALSHFKSLNITFDAVYSGFLGSEDQIETVEKYLDSFPNAVKLVDPVLGDDGKLYSTVTDSLVSGMKRLCEKADIITPNITEAAFLLSEDPNVVPTQDKLSDWLDRLSQNKRSVVITGVPYNGISNMGYDRETNTKFTVSSELVCDKYPGTGDIFASVLLGNVMNGLSLKSASQKAAAFTAKCITQTKALPEERRNGVSIEFCLKDLF